MLDATAIGRFESVAVAGFRIQYTVSTQRVQIGYGVYHAVKEVYVECLWYSTHLKK